MFVSKYLSSPFIRSLWQTIAILLLLILSFSIYVYAEKQIDRTNEARLYSFLLADELRQSSDDLTRMVRTYIVTENPLYKKHYQEILDIRNGQKPRPHDYQNIYWDLVELNDTRPRPQSNDAVALIDRMRQAGFTATEFAKLSEAKNNSDALTKIEFAAMKLIDTKGSTDERFIQKQKALELLHDATYHEAKASIMRPINEFYTLMDERTSKAVEMAEKTALILRLVFIMIGILFFLMLGRLHSLLKSILGSSIDEVHEHISRIGKGDFSHPIIVQPGTQESVIGWLGETQTRLQELIANNERLKNLYAALSQCNQAIVRSRDEEELFPVICRDAIHFGGMQMAWIGMTDPSLDYFKAVSFYGEGTDYLKGLRISTNPNDPSAQGPTGRAFHEDKPFWCQDFQNDPITAQWHERGKQYGWGSSAALPLKRNGNVIGVFTLYAKEKGAFDEPAQKLLEEMVMDISYALESFDRDRARDAAESSLADTNNLLTSIINTSPVRIFWKDQELNYLGCNLIFANDAGESDPQNVIGKNDTQLCWKEQAELYRADDLRVMQSGIPKLFFEEPQTTPDGSVIWLSTSKVPLYNKNHEIAGIVGIYEDITVRKMGEIALRNEKETAQNYLDIVGVMILILDVDKNVKLINRRGCEIIGYRADEVIGKNWIENFIPARLRTTIQDVSHDVLEQNKLNVSTFENPVLTQQGEERLILWNNTPLFDAEGHPIGILSSGEDITERRAAEERIHYLANFDELTGLPNRAQLDSRIQDLLSLAKRNHREITVMFLDLDHFKDINDTLGHSIGDDLLIEASKRLQSMLREEDTIARLGGDEFILLLPNISMHGAAQVAQKLLDAFKTPFHIEMHELSVTGSIGIALYPNDGTDFGTLYKNADTAMYHAKQEGRNGFYFFTEEMQKNSSRHLELGNALRHALERNQLQLHYQPQFSTENKDIIGAEALLRWYHPDFGNVSPAEFIPIAEENGTILSIGEWVLRVAVQTAKKWMDEGRRPIIMAVNLSAVQFRSLNLPILVADILNEVGLPPEYLELELTESIAMHDPQRAINIMNDLHQRGIRMSIDDFGTGYSSLSYLKKFNIYKLKIDQSFVRDINVDPEDKAIVAAIISMAKSLGLQTIAEGVETIAQLEYLHEQGCNEIQGYYFSKPLPIEEFEIFRNKK
ncbi:sensor domain-containing phosphodiesterase [Sulfuricurvum sp.]|uniref:sensor domain-containing phosphodiesterase n=1 Tax=Sulfuricurvum sp. TaxID=2025608 RepID=UPI003C58D0EC